MANDITYCTNTYCKYRDKCARADFSAAQHPVWVSYFTPDQQGNCKHFKPKTS